MCGSQLTFFCGMFLLWTWTWTWTWTSKENKETASKKNKVTVQWG